MMESEQSEPVISRKRRVLKPAKFDSETVHLVLYGPKWLLPVIPLTCVASKKETWLQVINGQLNLQMTPNDASSLMVRTRHYKAGVYGHSADLDTKITDFAQGFLYRKKTYFVLICGNQINQKRFSSNAFCESMQATARSCLVARSSVEVSTHVPAGVARSKGASVVSARNSFFKATQNKESSTSAQASVFKSGLAEAGGQDNRSRSTDEEDIQLIEPERVVDCGRSHGERKPGTSRTSDWVFEPPAAQVIKSKRLRTSDWIDAQDDYDVADSLADSVCGGEPGGPEVIEDLKSLVEGRVKNISNAFLLQARKQYRELKKERKWEKVVARFPLGGYILSEMFKE